MTGTYKPNGRTVANNGAEFFTYDPATDRLSSVVGYFDVLRVHHRISREE
jgi:hypothetical protein